MDPSLPEGHAFWLALHSQPQGLFFISGMAAPPSELGGTLIMVQAVWSGNGMRGSVTPVHAACAESSEDAEGWVDGLLMAAHIAAGEQLPALKHALIVLTS